MLILYSLFARSLLTHPSVSCLYSGPFFGLPSLYSLLFCLFCLFYPCYIYFPHRLNCVVVISIFYPPCIYVTVVSILAARIYLTYGLNKRDVVVLSSQNVRL